MQQQPARIFSPGETQPATYFQRARELETTHKLEQECGRLTQVVAEQKDELTAQGVEIQVCFLCTPPPPLLSLSAILASRGRID